MLNYNDGYFCSCSGFQYRYMSSFDSFPWHQNAPGVTKDDPIHHKLLGLFLLKRVLKNYAREDFNINEFIEGVRGAIKLLADCISTEDKYHRLQGILGPDLHAKFLRAFTSMKLEHKRVFLEIDAFLNFKIGGVRLICGGADEGDEYEINLLGQKIITSQRDMFEVEKRVGNTGYSNLFQYGKQLGASAAEKQLRFQIDIKVTTNEIFYIEEKSDDSYWELTTGERDVTTAKHKLRFESYLQDYEETKDGYPLSWKIVNVDFNDDEDKHDGVEE
eukprot:gene13822-15267_t